ncbi:hypothetical protein AOLI_G00165760 [Acnodon oligacanthus]
MSSSHSPALELTRGQTQIVTHCSLAHSACDSEGSHGSITHRRDSPPGIRAHVESPVHSQQARGHSRSSFFDPRSAHAGDVDHSFG